MSSEHSTGTESSPVETAPTKRRRVAAGIGRVLGRHRVNPPRGEQSPEQFTQAILQYAEAHKGKVWNRDASDAEATMNATSGPFIEVGGPTVRIGNNHIYQPNKLSKRLLVSNVIANPPKHEPRRVGRWPRRRMELLENTWEHEAVDFQADAAQLPLASQSVGALFESALPATLMPDFLNEAGRVVEPGGFLVLQAARAADVQDAASRNFELVRARLWHPESQVNVLNASGPNYAVPAPANFDVIMQKPAQ